MIKVTNEVTQLTHVLMHTPGKEIEQLTPLNLSRLLFEDMPFLSKAIEEHKAFVQLLESKGVEVLDIQDLWREVITSPGVYNESIHTLIRDIKEKRDDVVKHVKTFLDSVSVQSFADIFINGLRYDVVGLEMKEDVFIIDPIPNLFFQRDPMFVIGDVAVISRMASQARFRETFISKMVLKYHPVFKGITIIDMNDQPFSIEGGDILLHHNMIWIGISERTQKEAIIYLNNELIKLGKKYTIIAFELPKKRAYMHLDTILTILDEKTYIIDPLAFKHVSLFYVHETFEAINDSFEPWIQQINKGAVLIYVGGGDAIYSAREQWNDAANTVAIHPGCVIVYDRNHMTNDLIEKHGIQTLPIPSSELSRGRGGPHCMTMPLKRK